MARRKQQVARPMASWPKPVPVKDWMGQPAVTIRGEASVHEAIELMKTRKIRHLPVVDRDDRLAGIVTDRDLRHMLFDPAILERREQAAEILEGRTVREIMTWAVVTVGPQTELRQAARLMHEQKLGALPVVERHRVVGILTERDVLRAFATLPHEGVTSVRPLEAGAAGDERYEYGFPEPVWAEPSELNRD